MRKLLQTKEDIRRKMIDIFISSLPQVKNQPNFPVIAVKENEEQLNIFWIWLLPNSQAITYGENNQNRFIFHPNYKEPVVAANFNVSSTFEIIPFTRLNPENGTFENLKPSKTDLLATLEVKHLKYKFPQNSDNFIEDAAIIFTPSNAKPAEKSSLFCKETECEYL